LLSGYDSLFVGRWLLIAGSSSMVYHPFRRLILIKHALPVIDPAVASKDWRLSQAGQQGAARLATYLARYDLPQLWSSAEPKASATAAIVARALGVPYTVAPDLHENDRTGVPFVSATELRAMIARFLAAPDTLVMGRETARQAGDRFAAAVAAVLAQQPRGDVAIVAHGTVITLFVARHNSIAPFALWQQLGLPSFVVLDAETRSLQAIVGEPPDHRSTN
jgi:2,3-bisphosphoglycerate-dependent phosphoglycerate mutase